MNLTNIIQESNLRSYLEACQINKIEVIKKTKMVGIFGTDYEVVVKIKTPEQAYKLGLAMGLSKECEVSITDYEKNKCYI